ncbi:MAG: hypothetical protein ACI841_003113 [Planctomycetota bacterium]
MIALPRPMSYSEAMIFVSGLPETAPGTLVPAPELQCKHLEFGSHLAARWCRGRHAAKRGRGILVVACRDTGSVEFLVSATGIRLGGLGFGNYKWMSRPVPQHRLPLLHVLKATLCTSLTRPHEDWLE